MKKLQNHLDLLLLLNWQLLLTVLKQEELKNGIKLHTEKNVLNN